MSKKFLLATFLLGAFLLVGATAQAASPTFVANETVTNLVAGTDDQTAATSTTVNNVTQITASSTFTLSSVPTATSTVTFGQCLITLASSTDATNETDSTTCSGNTAHFELRSAVTATPYTASQLAANIRALTGVTSATHGALTIGGRENLVSISTTGVETSATIIEFSTTTAMSFATTTSGATEVAVAGRIPVAQTSTITIGGTVEENDVFTINSDGLHASYTVGSDSTTAHVASGLNSAIQAASGYAAAGFTSDVASNVVTLTASTAGTGFTAATSTTSNRAARAQTVTFTPDNVSGGKIFYVYINSNTYQYQAKNTDGLAEVLAGLVSALSTDPVATCSSTGTAVSCVAKSAGTAFTYSARVGSVGSSGSGSSSGGGGAPRVIVKPTPITPVVVAPTVLTRAWSYGKTSKEIKLLQQFLNNHGFTVAKKGAGSPGKETTYFGLATKTALIKFQKANKIKPANGVLNTQTRKLLNSL